MSIFEQEAKLKELEKEQERLRVEDEREQMNNEMEKKEQVKGQADSEMKSNDDKKS